MASRRASPVRHFHSKGILDPQTGFELRRDTLLDGDFAVHTHEFAELVIVTTGRALHVTQAEAYPIVAGDVFVTLPGQQHGYRKARGLRRTLFMFDPGRYFRGADDFKTLPGFHALFVLEPRYRRRHRFESRLRLDTPRLAAALELADRMAVELDGRKPGHAMMVRSLFHQLVLVLSRYYSPDDNPSAAALLRLAEVMSYMEQHCHASMKLPALARRAGLSANHFMRVFKDATGYTPIDYLLRVRVFRASRLLQTTSISVTDAGFEVGFTDSNYFSRQFKRVMGVSPTQFRQPHPRPRS